MGVSGKFPAGGPPDCAGSPTVEIALVSPLGRVGSALAGLLILLLDRSRRVGLEVLPSIASFLINSKVSNRVECRPNEESRLEQARFFLGGPGPFVVAAIRSFAEIRKRGAMRANRAACGFWVGLEFWGKSVDEGLNAVLVRVFPPFPEMVLHEPDAFDSHPYGFLD